MHLARKAPMALPRGAAAWAALALLAVVLLGCGYGNGTLVEVIQRPVRHFDPLPEGLHAGVAEVDITPPPGMPMYGYASTGVRSAEGYWLRLEARIIVLQQGPTRLALVQLDLGAGSALLHRRLADELHDIGIGPHNLMTATTHTHGGPGGYFGDKFYNEFVGARAGFDPLWLDWLVKRIAGGVREALGRMRPARLAVVQWPVAPEATFNRSIRAWRRNFDAHGLPHPPDPVERKLTLVRIDIDDETGVPRPAAAWTVFAVHGTSMPAKYPLHHGDIHGLAARLIRRWISDRYGVQGFVAATTNGAEGDVSPGWGQYPRGKQVTMAVAGHIARAAFEAFVRIDDAMAKESARKAPLGVAYREISMRGAGTRGGRLCQMPVLGAPQLAGSEEGRGPLYGFLQMIEAATREPSGCDATKVKIAGALQYHIVSPDDFPDVVPFQLVTLGAEADGVVLAAFPGEATTEVGRHVVRRVKQESGFARVAVVGLANGYATYFTTPEEFLAQHYEGGATLYGPWQGRFAEEQLERLAVELNESESAVDYFTRAVFRPGEAVRFWPAGGRCNPEAWRAGGLVRGEGTITFHWTGIAAGEACDLPAVRVVCGGAVLRDERGFPQTDEEFNFEVRRKAIDGWSALWTVRGRSARPCHFEVARPLPLSPLASASFSLEAR